MDNYRVNEPFKKQGLYDPALEHDNCGTVDDSSFLKAVDVDDRADAAVVVL